MRSWRISSCRDACNSRLLSVHQICYTPSLNRAMHTPANVEDGRLEKKDECRVDASQLPRSSANFAVSMSSEIASESEDLVSRPSVSKRRECVWVNHWKPELGFSNDEDNDKQEFLKRTTIIFHQLEVLMWLSPICRIAV